MASDNYQFERPFRMKIIMLMLDNAWMAKYGSSLIAPEYFEQEDEVAVSGAIITYRKLYGKSPRDMDDIVEIAGAKYSDFISKIYDGYEESDLSLAADKVITFAKEQAAKLAILDSVDFINKGDLQTPIKKMQEALIVGDSVLSPGIDPVRDVDKWIWDIYTDKTHTGMLHLDESLDGGLSTSELGIVLAPPNRGKSMLLVNIGYGAASIGSGKNVVHFTHEMSPAKVAKRYAARITFKFPHHDESIEEYTEKFLLAARKLVPGKIRIIGGATKMGIPEIEGHMDRLIAEGFNPGLIIDDYPDLIIPPRHYGEKRFELSAIYEWCRSLSEKYNCPVWGASQATRAALSKEIITMQDIAEDIGKAAIADVIIALCQTREEEQVDQCRLFIAKLRDGSKKNPMIGCKYYGESQAIITTGYVREKVEETDA